MDVPDLPPSISPDLPIFSPSDGPRYWLGAAAAAIMPWLL
jgi:hypothetical protein